MIWYHGGECGNRQAHREGGKYAILAESSNLEIKSGGKDSK